MVFKRLLLWGILAVVCVTGAGVQAQQPLDVLFFLTFVPNVQFSPVYVALEKGYFAEQGLNVTVEHGDENVGVEMIASNQRLFGLISGEEVIKARANGRPVVSIYEWFQRYPVGIVYPEGAGINSVADLRGRKVGIPGLFGASLNGLTALLAVNSMTTSDIQLETIGFTAPDTFCLGAVQASVVYINNEPLQISNRIAKGECNGYTGVQVLPVSAAADMVSNGLVTNEDVLEQNPDLARRMVEAFNKGLQDVINNPAEAYLISTKYVENLAPSADLVSALQDMAATQTQTVATAANRQAIADGRAILLDVVSTFFTADELVQLQVLLNTIELWDADILGFATPESWQTTQATLLAMQAIPTTIDVNLAFTNRFIGAG